MEPDFKESFTRAMVVKDLRPNTEWTMLPYLGKARTIFGSELPPSGPETELFPTVMYGVSQTSTRASRSASLGTAGKKALRKFVWYSR